jgi:prepilin-type processing-associated H-X9-DG protein
MRVRGTYALILVTGPKAFPTNCPNVDNTMVTIQTDFHPMAGFRLRPQSGRARHIPAQAGGFSLLELLVASAVVIVLAAIVFTATKAATRTANSAKAISNLKQTGVLAMTYASDNNNRLPLSATSWESMTQGRITWFQGDLADHSGLEIDWTKPHFLPEIFYDPGLKREREHPWGSFGVNTSIILDEAACRLRYGHTQGISLTVIANPAQKVIYSSTSAGRNSAQFDSSWFFSGASFVQQGMNPSIEHPDPRNSRGAASLFADGHVEKLDVKSMDRATRQRYFVLDP